MTKLLTRKKASEVLGIHYHTLYSLAKKGEIKAVKVGSRQMYDVDSYLKSKGLVENSTTRRKICYCRVSSSKQRSDLRRQAEYMKEKYPTYEIIKDIGSGLNYKRKGLKKIIDYAVKGEIEVLIIAYKDRLTRFGYELFEYLIKTYSNGLIRIENKKEEETPTEEISKDILSIMNVYVAKINGLRKYKKMIKKEIKGKNGKNKKN